METYNWGYFISAAFQSFTTAALCTYPIASAYAVPGLPHSSWVVMSLVLSAALIIYSALLPQGRLRSLNFLVIPLVCILVLSVAWLVRPDRVGDAVGGILFLSVFTLGAPLWLPAGALVVHAMSCRSDAESTVGKRVKPLSVR